MFFNLPTLFTWARIVAIPLVVGVYYSGLSPEAQNIVGTALFVLFALTDWADGYLARKLNMTSSFGAFLDPVADKFLVTAALLVLPGVIALTSTKESARDVILRYKGKAMQPALSSTKGIKEAATLRARPGLFLTADLTALTAQMDEAAKKLGEAVEAAFHTIGVAAKDKAVQEDVKQVGRSVADALAGTLAGLSDEMKKTFGKQGSATGPAASSETPPPPPPTWPRHSRSSSAGRRRSWRSCASRSRKPSDWPPSAPSPARR